MMLRRRLVAFIVLWETLCWMNVLLISGREIVKENDEVSGSIKPEKVNPRLLESSSGPNSANNRSPNPSIVLPNSQNPSSTSINNSKRIKRGDSPAFNRDRASEGRFFKSNGASPLATDNVTDKFYFQFQVGMNTSSYGLGEVSYKIMFT